VCKRNSVAKSSYYPGSHHGKQSCVDILCSLRFKEQLTLPACKQRQGLCLTASSFLHRKSSLACLASLGFHLSRTASLGSSLMMVSNKV
jgi:hypothetical protein